MSKEINKVTQYKSNVEAKQVTKTHKILSG